MKMLVLSLLLFCVGSASSQNAEAHQMSVPAVRAYMKTHLLPEAAPPDAWLTGTTVQSKQVLVGKCGKERRRDYYTHKVHIHAVWCRSVVVYRMAPYRYESNEPLIYEVDIQQNGQIFYCGKRGFVGRDTKSGCYSLASSPIWYNAVYIDLDLSGYDGDYYVSSDGSISEGLRTAYEYLGGANYW